MSLRSRSARSEMPRERPHRSRSIGLITFFAVAPAMAAVPATRALLPMAITGAMNSNRAECFRVFLCTIFSSHHESPRLCPRITEPRLGASPPHRESGVGLHCVTGSKLLKSAALAVFVPSSPLSWCSLHKDRLVVSPIHGGTMTKACASSRCDPSHQPNV